MFVLWYIYTCYSSHHYPCLCLCLGSELQITYRTPFLLTGIPGAIGQALEQSRQGDLSILLLIGIGLLSMAVIAVVVFIERGQRRITVNYAQRQQGRRMMQAQQSHLPFTFTSKFTMPNSLAALPALSAAI